MTVEVFPSGSFKILSNSGVSSEQLLSPANSESKRVTITRVTVAPGTEQPRHAHSASEQVLFALSGNASLLLARDSERSLAAGDVVRITEGKTHGIRNRSSEPFVYLSVTAPPIDFQRAYAHMS